MTTSPAFKIGQTVTVISGYGSQINGQGGIAKVSAVEQKSNGVWIYKLVYKNRHLSRMWLAGDNLQA